MDNTDQLSSPIIPTDAEGVNININTNDSIISSSNQMTPFEMRIAAIIGITFSITFIVGIIGNSLVLITILFQKQMRSTTNILILNLAIAELLFILICVPSTGLNYVLSKWYFGDLGCRIVQYTSNVTAYVIILLLVFMSFDRYLAIRIVGGTSIRNQRNAIIAVTFLWLLVLLFNVPHLFLWVEHRYVAEHSNENRTVCILKYNIIVAEQQGEFNESEQLEQVNRAERMIQVYYSVFVLAAYLLPFLAIVAIYGLIMMRLRQARGQQVSKSKRRVTFMVILVVLSFVLCWGPLQLMLFLQHVLKIHIQAHELGITILVISNCIAYLNTCINPIIYGFANHDFRAAYAAVLKCECNRKTYTAVATQINPRELSRVPTVKSATSSKTNNLINGEANS